MTRPVNRKVVGTPAGFAAHLKQVAGTHLVGVEIGVASGGNIDNMLNEPDLIDCITGIDPYEHYDEYTDAGSRPVRITHPPMDVRRRLAEQLADEQKRFTLIVDYSERVVAQFEDAGLDFVFVDGNHRYEYCKQDIELWWPKIKKGGWMFGHDWQMGSVKRAVKECFAKDAILTGPAQTWRVRK